ncbi:MAG: Hpt domain-containing protein [Pseudomonadota bacterium]
MSGKHDQIALGWVREEVNKTLDQARQALEAYAENSDDLTQIRFCISCLHQVRGTLQMLEFYGASLMAEELEMLATALSENNVVKTDKALEELMGGIVQLPVYLERVQKGQKDIPMVLLPILNELRATRGESLLSESAVFTPDLSSIEKRRQKVSDNKSRSEQELKDTAKKLRHHYQKGLLGILKNTNLRESFARLHKVLERLEIISSSNSISTLWWVANGFLVVIREDRLFKNASIHALLGQIDKHIRAMAESGLVAANSDVSNDLLKNLLYYVAKSESQDVRVQSIQQTFQLAEVMPDNDKLEEQRSKIKGPDSAAIETVVGAIKDDLASVKDNLDLFVRSSGSSVNDLQSMMQPLRQISDTLAMLGLGVPRDVVKQQLDSLKELIDENVEPDDALIMDIAGALLFVEANLSSLKNDKASDMSQTASEGGKNDAARQFEFDDAKMALLTESRNNLQKSKDAIIDFMASSWDHRLIKDVPKQLAEIKGGVTMVGLDKPAELLDICAQYIQSQLLVVHKIPDEKILDALADVITSIEYFLEGMLEEQGGGLDNVLMAANDSAEILREILEANAVDIPAEPVAETPEEPKPTQTTPQTATMQSSADVDEELIDDEVREIFLEEAEEELVSISNLLPSWLDDSEDSASLSTIRRSFHTLKGSGRLVGAEIIGELAWAIENLLNRVLDNTIDTTSPTKQAVSDAREMLPELILAFKENRTPHVNAEELRVRAHALAKGEEPPLAVPPAEVSALEAQSQTPTSQQPSASSGSDASDLIGQSESSTLDLDEAAIETQDHAISAPEVETENVPHHSVPDTSELRLEEEIDPVLLEIFSTEAEAHITDIANFLSKSMSSPVAPKTSDELVRALHTLKGSANMAGVTPIARVVSPLETLFKELKNRDAKISDQSMALLSDVKSFLSQGIKNLQQNKELDLESAAQFIGRTAVIYEELMQAQAEQELNRAAERDSELLSIFLSEGVEILTDADNFLKAWHSQPDNEEAANQLEAEMHTLRRGANMAMLPEVEELAGETEVLFKRFINYTNLPESFFTLANDSLEQLHNMLDKAAAEQDIIADNPLLQKLRSYQLPAEQAPADESQDTTTFIPDTDELSAELEALSSDLEPLPEQEPDSEQLPEEGDYDLSDYPAAESQNLSAESQSFEESGTANEALENSALSLSSDEDMTTPASSPITELENELAALSEGLDFEEPPLESTPQASQAAQNDAPDDEVFADSQLEEATPSWEQPVIYPFDEMMEIFIEEALDILDQIGESTHHWYKEVNNTAIVAELQRNMHTLKGSARMAGAERIGALGHALEDIYEGIVDGILTPHQEHVLLAEEVHDTLAVMVEAVRDGRPVADPAPLLQKIADIANTSRERFDVTTPIADIESTETSPLSVTEPEAFGESAETDTNLEPQETTESLEETESDELSLDENLPEDSLSLEPRSDAISSVTSEEPEPEAEEINYLLNPPASFENDNAESDDVIDVSHESENSENAESLIEYTLSPSAEDNALPVTPSDDQEDNLEDLLSVEESATLDLPDTHTLEEAFTAPQEEELPESLETLEAFVAEEPPAYHSEPQAPMELDTHGDVNEADSEVVYEVDDLMEIFLEEAQEILESIGEVTDRWGSDLNDVSAVAELQRNMHTLKGSSRMSGANRVGNLGHALEDVYEALVDGLFPATPQLLALAEETHDKLLDMVNAIEQREPVADPTALINRIKAVAKTGNLPEHTAQDADALPAADILSSEQEDDISALIPESIEIPEIPDSFEVTTAEETLETEVSTIDASEVTETPASFELSDAYDETAETLDEDPIIVDDEDSVILDQEAQAPVPVIEPSGLDTVEALEFSEDDEEILSTYLEEADEILEGIDDVIADWIEIPDAKDQIDLLQRNLHTLKGGARLAGLTAIGDLTHELETYFEHLGQKVIDYDPRMARVIQEGSDHLVALVREVSTKRSMTHQKTYINKLTAAMRGEFASETFVPPQEIAIPRPAAPISAEKSQASHSAQVVSPTFTQEKPTEDNDLEQASPRKQATIVPMRLKSRAERRAEKREEAQKSPTTQAEAVRVGSDTLENLVNLAGETSIFRSRLEQQILELRTNLEEMGATVERLRTQLRNLEIETEAQVVYRREVSGHRDYEDFDPLEMDRYNRQQELTRSLGESAADLLNLKDSLDTLASDSETLLLQQGRVNTELQERLMRTRMVPFTSIVPRLRRIVRQIGRELGKPVEMSISAEGEMDRTVLERMVAPIEHMLRNAIDHGIESPHKRMATNKPETGKIKIKLFREGGEVVILVADDGGGINHHVIREKAIERGLIKEDSHLTKHELQQLILEAGFSTAETVTQISGRGVGMDVVASEIKQMGGLIDIDSDIGQGSTFTVRLPFTVSVNQALMVNIGEEIYAVPLSSIEGIVRVSPYELQELFSHPNPEYTYAGIDYHLKYLGALIEHQKSVSFENITKPVPVLLLHGADNPVAVQVDDLMGSREIVVKSVGHQLSTVSGLSGATILGDGRVVLILDILALLRLEEASIESVVPIDTNKTDRETPLVMVVDDSITVRKVTARLLERHDFDVLTAKDGVDALTLLQENQPDVMLLDIEMPRMDGFELATIVRHDERLKSLPIIMITSRTGEKHRARAEQIGVNHYMGKPFNEAELLDTIQSLVHT